MEQSQKQNKKPMEFTFQAGEMRFENNKAIPNPDKGLVRIYINPDNILCLEWKNLDKNTVTDPIAIMEGLWKWRKIPSKKGRVYLLQSTEDDEDRYCFWLQYPPSMDESIMTIVNNIIKTGQLAINEEKNTDGSSQPQPMSVEEVQQSENNTNTINNNNNVNVNANNSFNAMIKSFQDAIKKIQKKFPELQQVLTRINAIDLIKELDENKVKELIQLLPEKQRSLEGLKENVSCAQFQQALEQLSIALNSENFASVIMSFGLSLEDCKTCTNGVEGFIKCILAKFPKKNN